jgi:hypothetical protein
MKITESQLRNMIKKELASALAENAQTIDNQELQAKFEAFLKTPEGKKAQQLANVAKTALTKNKMNEALSDMDASLAATGIFAGPFLAHLAATGVGINPSLENNVLGFLMGVLGGGAIGLGLDYLRRDKKNTESEVPSAGSARFKTDPRAGQGPRY